jgi:hypothetical protein
MGYRFFAVSLLLVSSLCSPQDNHGSTSGGIVTITVDHQCVNIFGGILRANTKRDEETEQGVQIHDRAVHVTLTLTPGCERGVAAIRTGIWPEFSKKLHFDFALFERSDELNSENHSLRAEVMEDYTPLWRETGSVRTLVFALPDLPTNSHGELLVSISLSDTKLAKLKLKLIPQ